MSKTPKEGPPADPVDIALGRRLRLLRRHARMSQERLGQASGVSFQQVQKYERGVNRISVSRLVQFAEVLGVPPAQLLDDAASASPSGNANDTDALVRLFSEVKDPEVRRMVLSLVERLRS